MIEGYTITPKGIAALSLFKSGLVESFDDHRIEAFWTIFDLMMEKHGYIQTEEDEEDGDCDY